jgi:hypothetical protein
VVSGYEPSGLTYGANDEAKLEEFIAVEGTLIRGPLHLADQRLLESLQLQVTPLCSLTTNRVVINCIRENDCE